MPMELSNYTFETELCEIAFKYGTDKCPQLAHTYTPFYYNLFKNKRKLIKKVLEIGIGPYRGKRPRRYTLIGSSLYMWRDFFPNALIFGAEINPAWVFEDERIKVFQCDQKKREDLLRVVKNIGADIDLVIDDACHDLKAQVYTCLTLMPLLKKDAVYIIEDALYSQEVKNSLKEYRCSIPRIANRGDINQLVVVKTKNRYE